MSAPRRAWAEVVYEGRDISGALEPYLLGVAYSDHRGGKADEVTIDLEDRAGLWRGAWLPGVGDTIAVRLHAEDWGEGEGSLYCGTFTLDKISLSGPPSAVRLAGVSVRPGSAARATRRSRAWEGTTIRQIALDVATGAGLSLVWDVSEALPAVDREEQRAETDLAYLARLTRAYNLELKVHAGQAVVWDVAAYQDRPSVTTYTLGESRVLSWDLAVKAYMHTPRVRVSYQDPWAGALQEATRTQAEAMRSPRPDDPLGLDAQSFDDNSAEVLRVRARSVAEAEAKAKAALLRRQEHTAEGSITVVGDVRLVAANPIQLAGWHKLDGRYLLDTAEHSLGPGGYTVRAQIRRASP